MKLRAGMAVSATMAAALFFAACSGSGGPEPDVYVTGGDDFRATLWKNGEAKRISLGYAWLTSVHVSGGDVYVTGGDGYLPDYWLGKATVWKNGDATRLSDHGSEASSVFVSNGKVYVAGAEKIDGIQYATLWVDGVAQHLVSGDQAEWWGYAHSVFVSGDDVYVTVTEHDGRQYSGVVYKNGVAERLGDEGFGASPESIFVSGGDVYLVGSIAVAPLVTRAAV
jgi:hypothetical protein